MATSILTVAMSIQLSPLLQKFWFFVFLTGFDETPEIDDVGANVQSYWSHYYLTKIDVSYFTMQTTFLSCISMLTVITAVIGRVNLGHVTKMVSFFQIFWNLNYYLNIYLAIMYRDMNHQESYTPYFFDAFGSTYVYLFAGFFGLAFTCMLGKQKMSAEHPRNTQSRFSLVLSLIGTGFIFATFYFTSNYLIAYDNFGQNASRFSFLFGLIGSVVGTYIGSALAGKGRVGYK